MVGANKGEAELPLAKQRKGGHPQKERGWEEEKGDL